MRASIELTANAAEIPAKTLHIEKLRMQLAVLRRARFGQSSEKIDGRIEQLELLIGELEEEEAATAARREATPTSGSNDLANPAARERRQPVRRPLPPHLPRETVTHEPPQVCPECGGSRFSRIGDDEREVLEYTPASFRVIRHVRPKLSCRGCETIVQRSMPSLPIERGLPGPGLITQVLVAKFAADHLPLHRQSGIYQRAGVELDRATLADWVGRAVFLSHHWPRPSDITSARDRCYMPTIPPSQCWRPGSARPEPADCGLSCAMNAGSAQRCRLGLSIFTHRTGRPFTPSDCSAPVGVGCTRTDTTGSGVCTSSEPLAPSQD